MTYRTWDAGKWAVEAKDGPKAKWKLVDQTFETEEQARAWFEFLDEHGGAAYRVRQITKEETK